MVGHNDITDFEEVRMQKPEIFDSLLYLSSKRSQDPEGVAITNSNLAERRCGSCFYHGNHVEAAASVVMAVTTPVVEVGHNAGLIGLWHSRHITSALYWKNQAFGSL